MFSPSCFSGTTISQAFGLTFPLKQLLLGLPVPPHRQVSLPAAFAWVPMSSLKPCLSVALGQHCWLSFYLAGHDPQSPCWLLPISVTYNAIMLPGGPQTSSLPRVPRGSHPVSWLGVTCLRVLSVYLLARPSRCQTCFCTPSLSVAALLSQSLGQNCCVVSAFLPHPDLIWPHSQN